MSDELVCPKRHRHIRIDHETHCRLWDEWKANPVALSFNDWACDRIHEEAQSRPAQPVGFVGSAGRSAAVPVGLLLHSAVF